MLGRARHLLKLVTIKPDKLAFQTNVQQRMRLRRVCRRFARRYFDHLSRATGAAWTFGVLLSSPLNQLLDVGFARRPTHHGEARGTAIALGAIEDAAKFSFRLNQAAFTFGTDEHVISLTENIRSVRLRFS